MGSGQSNATDYKGLLLIWMAFCADCVRFYLQSTSRQSDEGMSALSESHFLHQESQFLSYCCGVLSKLHYPRMQNRSNILVVTWLKAQIITNGHVPLTYWFTSRHANQLTPLTLHLLTIQPYKLAICSLGPDMLKFLSQNGPS